MFLAPAHPRSRRRILTHMAALFLLAGPALPARAEAEPAADTQLEADAAADDDATSGADAADPAAITRPILKASQVTVTSTRTANEILDTAGNVSVIDREEIEKSGARDVPDLLRRESGIYVTNTTGNREGYTVEGRGFANGGGNGGRMLVLVDGRRINEENTARIDWSFIALDNIEKIEIVRGPVSAAHGDNALGGVISIFTSLPTDDGMHATVRTRAGTFDTGNYTAQVGGKHGNLSGTAFFEYDSTDAYRDRADHRVRNGEMRLRWDFDGFGFIDVKGGYGSVKRLRPGTLTQVEISQDRRQAQPGSADNNEVARQRFIQATLELRPTENITLRVLPFHRRKSSDGQFDDPTFIFANDTEQDALGLNTQVEFDYLIGGVRNRLLVGGDLLQEDVDNDALFTSISPFGNLDFPTMTRARRKVWGAFIQNELWITETILLALGTRYDESTYKATDRVQGRRFETAHSEWAPRAALSWRFCEIASVYGSYSRGFRFPNLTEVFGNFGNNPGLVPETSDAWETGIKVRAEKVTFNLSLYHMTVKDEILFNPEAVNPFFLPLEFKGIDTNLDRVKHRGIEIAGSYRPFAWIEIWANYTFDDVEVSHDLTTFLSGNRVPITPKHRGNGGVRLYLPHGFEASVLGRWVGPRYLANDLTNEFPKMSSFATWDARLAWRRELNEWVTIDFEAVMYNFTGRKYNEFGGRSTFPPPRVGFFPNPRTHYMLGARITVRR